MVAIGQKVCYNRHIKSQGGVFMAFLGEFSHQLDDKNRIRIPTQFKEQLGSSFYLSKGLDGTINILPVKVVEAQLEKLQSCISEFDEAGQEALFEYTSTIYEVKEDKHGRIRIPDVLVEFANLEKDLVTIGAINKLSLMSKDVRDKRKVKRTHAETMAIINDRLKG